MIIKRNETKKYSRQGMSGEYYQMPDFRGGTSYALAEFTGEHGERTTGKRERVYFVISGDAVFQLDGIETEVGEGDLVVVPAETTYNFWPMGKSVKVFVELEYIDIDKLPK